MPKDRETEAPKGVEKTPKSAETANDTPSFYNRETACHAFPYKQGKRRPCYANADRQSGDRGSFAMQILIDRAGIEEVLPCKY